MWQLRESETLTDALTGMMPLTWPGDAPEVPDSIKRSSSGLNAAAACDDGGGGGSKLLPRGPARLGAQNGLDHPDADD